MALAHNREQLCEDLILNLKVQCLLLRHVFEQKKAFLELSVNQSAYIVSRQLVRRLYLRLLVLMQILLELARRHATVLQHAFRGEGGSLRLGDGAALDVIRCAARIRSSFVMVWGVLARHLGD